MDINLPEMRINIFQGQSLRLRVHGIDQDDSDYVKGHKDEEGAGTNIPHCDRPDLSDNDSAD